MAHLAAAIPIDVVKEVAGGFGSLSAALTTVYTNHEVRLCPARNYPLTNPSAGNRRRQKQDRKPPLTHSRN